MVRATTKNVRKLVTLSPDLAERVDEFRKANGVSSESEALKALIEDGLKLRDRPEDLFHRCKAAIESGQNIGDLINSMTLGHPLVISVVIDNESLQIYLKHDSDMPRQRFRYSRLRRLWHWEYERDFDNWTPVIQETATHAVASRTTRGADLDDEIPF